MAFFAAALAGAMLVSAFSEGTSRRAFAEQGTAARAAEETKDAAKEETASSESAETAETESKAAEQQTQEAAAAEKTAEQSSEQSAAQPAEQPAEQTAEQTGDNASTEDKAAAEDNASAEDKTAAEGTASTEGAAEDKSSAEDRTSTEQKAEAASPKPDTSWMDKFFGTDTSDAQGQTPEPADDAKSAETGSAEQTETPAGDAAAPVETPSAETAEPVQETPADYKSDPDLLPYGSSTRALSIIEDDKTVSFKNLSSNFAVLVDVDNGHVVATKNADALMYPASMTKIMTILVASEYITKNGKSLTDTFTITQDILDYVVAEEGTAVGFVTGENPTVMDLLWGTALPSGADAALGIARYVAGTDEAFVAMMNEKAKSLGLTHTHFTNPVGMYDDENYTTPKEMAVILHAATKNPLAWAILSTQSYTTAPTRQHPEGVTVMNRFLVRLSRQSVPGIVFSAKTGYVAKAGSCAASFFVASDDRTYICVTGQANGTWQCIYDQAAIYRVYCTPPETEEEEITEEQAEEMLGEEAEAAQNDIVNAGATDENWKEN